MKRLLLFLLLFAPTLAAQNPVSGGPIPQSTYTTLPASSSTIINGAGTNPLGVSLNVKAAPYNAVGNTQSSDNATITGATTLTCTDCVFTAADIGKTFSCGFGYATFMAPSTAVTFVSATVVTIPSSSNGPCTVVWGKDDTVAIQTAVTDYNAALKTIAVAGNIGVVGSPNPPVLYFPCGNYSLAGSPGNAILAIAPSAGARSGGQVLGCGRDGTKLTFLTGSSPANGLIRMNSNNSAMTFADMTIDGANGAQTAAFGAVMIEGNQVINNVRLQRLGTATAMYASGTFDSTGLQTTNNNGIGLNCTNCRGEFRGAILSNSGNQANLSIQGVNGSTATQGLRFFDGLVDECGSNTTGCIQLINSNDVWFIGMSAFGTQSGFCLNVDANSFLHWVGGICGVFGVDTNTSGPRVAAGGAMQASDLRSISSGTGKCITVAAAGLFNDNGGNSCESVFTIASGTSTGTTAVITTNNLGAAPNANCSVNDALLVENAGIAGYDGYFPAPAITAVTATTITYLTQGSNLGALGAGGSIHCRNLQQYSGTLPKPLLNTPIPNTCYVTITPIVSATTYQMCNFGAGSATNITRITASSQVVTTCATAPIITISNGTVSQTFTLTTGKQFWDSFNAQDASTGVNTTIFKQSVSATGTDRITVKYDAGAVSACATPPTQLAVSYTIAPILSN